MIAMRKRIETKRVWICPLCGHDTEIIMVACGLCGASASDWVKTTIRDIFQCAKTRKPALSATCDGENSVKFVPATESRVKC